MASRFRAEGQQPRPGQEPGSLTSLFQSLYDLFTRDVTREGLRDLIQRDPKAAFKYFSKDLDLAALGKLPWYRRYPELVGRIFVSLAYQLTPPRRIAFAVGCVAVLLGLIPRLGYSTGGGIYRITIHTGFNFYWVIALGIFLLLLLMELRDKLSLKADLEIAREIQSGLVAAGAYTRKEYRIFCRMRPANTVGGDYCDIIDLGEPDRFAVVIGDVSGKGMPAALLVALLQGSLRTLITAGHRGADLVSKLNTYLSATIPPNVFVTMFYAEFNTATGELLYVNAGHNAPFLIRCGRATERLGSNSIVLGFFGDAVFTVDRIFLYALDELVLFTDGLPEAANPEGEEFGEERVGAILLEHLEADQSQLLERLIQSAVQHCGDNRPHDDMTLISVIRGAPVVDVMNPVIPPPIPTNYA